MKGEVFGFETDTVWGMGCHPLDEFAVKKIYEFKKREKAKPLILMSRNIKLLEPYIYSIPPYAKELIKKYFPGGLTLIFQKSPLCPSFVTSGQDTVGIRIPNHKGFMELTKNVEGGVLATTSLNLSGEPPVENYSEAVKKFGDKIKIVNFKNNSPVSKIASTVVLCTDNKPSVLRQGEIIL